MSKNGRDDDSDGSTYSNASSSSSSDDDIAPANVMMKKAMSNKAGRTKAKNEPIKKKGKKTTGEVLSMCIA